MCEKFRSVSQQTLKSYLTDFLLEFHALVNDSLPVNGVQYTRAEKCAFICDAPARFFYMRKTT